MRNYLTMTLKLNRIDVCDLLLASSAADSVSGGARKWERLRGKLKAQLDEFDNEIDELDQEETK